MKITNDNFEHILSTDFPVMIDIYAPWCGPCKQISPVIDELIDEYQGKIIIGKLNVDEIDNKVIATQYGIRNIPAFLFFKNGELVDKLVGQVTKEELIVKLESII